MNKTVLIFVYSIYEIFEVATGLIILVEDYKEIKKRNIVEVLN